VLTRSDDLNALADAELRTELGHERVLRLAPDPERSALVPPEHEEGLLLTFAELTAHITDGSRVVAEAVEPGRFALYLEGADGSRTPATRR
jgi:hypothetical protein